MNTTLLITMAAGGGGNMSFIIMMVVIFAIMWFFMIRPQQKKQKELQNFRNSISVGAQVVTAGGIFGTVRQIVEEDNTLIVEIAKDVKIKVDKNSVFASAPSADKK
ncbi:MAG: preprotein translocase subunit YajC [Prevotellaceae bacterium]|nr:preprotein translocase subunit YajC [Prevotellaceae bacterium]